jgi:NRAMP (natural resistance-associated macrophage protein)-like metal ion transporter
MLTLHHARKFADRFGPGLITGAADDDPSGLATYSQAGAQFGVGLLWTLAFTTPLMISIQMVSARIGWLTGQGLAANIRRAMPQWATVGIVALLVFANTLNIAADIAAMGEALQLVVGGPEHGHAVVFGILCTVLPLWLNYEAMVSVLKWLTLALLSYVAVVFMLHVEWNRVLLGAAIPTLQTGGPYWVMVVAVLGTTISPYLFFWQASQEA